MTTAALASATQATIMTVENYIKNFELLDGAISL
jgi:hypothetical protein